MPHRNNPLTTLKAPSDRLRYPPDDDELVSSTTKSSRPKAQDNETAIRRKEEQEAMENAVDEWVMYTMAKAAELSERFDKKPRYFLDRFFLGGQKLIYKQNVTNPFNAFKSVKAAHLRNGTFHIAYIGILTICTILEGEKENAIEIGKRYKSEYIALTPEERAKYVAEFEALKGSTSLIRRHTSRGCIQDVANVVRNMQKLVRQPFYLAFELH
jgi:hypothetical protein